MKKRRHKITFNLKKIKNKRNSNEKMINRIAEFLEIPEELMGDNTKITLVDNRYLYLEGNNQIEDYYNHYIKIKTKKHVISLDGKNMQIKEISDKELCVEGEILSITYEGRVSINET